MVNLILSQTFPSSQQYYKGLTVKKNSMASVQYSNLQHNLQEQADVRIVIFVYKFAKGY